MKLLTDKPVLIVDDNISFLDSYANYLDVFCGLKTRLVASLAQMRIFPGGCHQIVREHAAAILDWSIFEPIGGPIPFIENLRQADRHFPVVISTIYTFGAFDNSPLGQLKSLPDGVRLIGKHEIVDKLVPTLYELLGQDFVEV